MSKLLQRIVLGLILAGAVIHGLARAESPMVNTDDQGRAIKGYDAVSYFTEGAPREGNPEISLDWMGATWLFATPEHREAFKADPERYAPQFGGYCAYAVAKGNPAQADPRIWAIVDEKLYLNLAPGVQEKWEADRTALIAGARNNWPEVLKGPAKQGQKAGAANR
jgi:YHS domain-containing protein